LFAEKREKNKIFNFIVSIKKNQRNLQFPFYITMTIFIKFQTLRHDGAKFAHFIIDLIWLNHKPREVLLHNFYHIFSPIFCL